MSLEYIKLITEAESLAQKRMDETKARAGAIIAAARDNGAAERSRQRAAEEIEIMMEKAKELAKAQTGSIEQKLNARCSQLEATANKRLHLAARLIVERIVNG